MSPRSLARSAVPAALAAGALVAAGPACGRAELEQQLYEARAERASIEKRTEEKLAAAAEAARLATAVGVREKTRADSLADELAASAKAVAERDERLEKAKKDAEKLAAHRDELTEWIEKELLPVAEQHQPELVNLRTATEEMQKEVARIRGLEWKAPVMRRRIVREQVAEWMQRDMRKELTPEKAFEIVTVGAEMGLVAPKTDLYAMFSDFMTAGAAAFYKPDTRTFYHIEGNDGRGAYPVVFHELVHALEDQYFDLDAFYQVVDDDSDRALARRAVVEGSASWYQDRYQAEHPEDVREMMRSQMTPEMVQRQGQMLAKVPAFLVATMGLYPYNNAKSWIGEVTQGDGAKLAALYREPPESTEQVLHPEKFTDPARRDWPHRIAAPDLAFLPPEWKRLDADSLGELTIGCLLAQLKYPGPPAFLAVADLTTGGVAFKKPVKGAIEGWDGDRYSCAIDPSTNRATVVWVSVWDSEADAREFADTYAPLVGKKVTKAPLANLPSPVRYTEKDSDRVTAIEVRGTRVVAVLGSPPAMLDRFLESGLSAKSEADPRDAADAGGTPTK